MSAHSKTMLAAWLVVGAIAATVVVFASSAGAQTFVTSPAVTHFNQEIRGAGGPGGIPVAQPDGYRYWGRTAAKHYTIDIVQFQDTLHPRPAGTDHVLGL